MPHALPGTSKLLNSSYLVNRSALAVIIGMSALFVVGCDNPAHLADIQAEQKVAKATQDQADGKLDAALRGFGEAANTPGISNELSYRSHYLEAISNVRMAEQAMNQAQSMELNISAILQQMGMENSVLASTQQELKSLAGYDPAPMIAQLNNVIAQAKGSGADSRWTPPAPMGADGAKLSAVDPQTQLWALSALDAQIQTLEGQIKDNRAKAQSISDRRKASLEQGDDLQLKSKGESGQQSVDDYDAGVKAQADAAARAIEIEKQDAELVKLQSDLAACQSQKKQASTLIDSMQKQIEAVTASWQTMQSDMANKKKSIVTMLGDAGAPVAQVPAASPGVETSADAPASPVPPTVNAQADALKTQLMQAHDLREKAADQLKTAIRNFNQATSAGNQVRAELASLSESARVMSNEKFTFANLQESFSSGDSMLAGAQAERLLGLNYATQAMLGYQTKQVIAHANEALADQTPASLTDLLKVVDNPSVDDLTKLAEESFKNAMDHFDSATLQTTQTAGANIRKIGAYVGKMQAAFDAKQLSLSLNKKPIAGQTPEELQAQVNEAAGHLADLHADDHMPAVEYTLQAPTSEPST